VALQQLCLVKGGESRHPFTFSFAQEILRPDGKLEIHLVTPDSISPKSLSASSDKRVLGVGIKPLKFDSSIKGKNSVKM